MRALPSTQRRSVSGERSAGMPSATPQGTRSAGEASRRSPISAASPTFRRWASRSQAAVSTAACAKRLPANAGAQERVHVFRRCRPTLPTTRGRRTCSSRWRALASGLVRVERQLERRRLAITPVALLVVEHDDQRTALVHGAARDDERLDQRKRQLATARRASIRITTSVTSRKRSSPSRRWIRPSASRSSRPAMSPLSGSKEQRVERPLGAGTGGGGILRERQLKEGVQLDALAAELGVLQNHPARGDVTGAGEWRMSNVLSHAPSGAPADCDRSDRIRHTPRRAPPTRGG